MSQNLCTKNQALMRTFLFENFNSINCLAYWISDFTFAKRYLDYFKLFIKWKVNQENSQYFMNTSAVILTSDLVCCRHLIVSKLPSALVMDPATVSTGYDTLYRWYKMSNIPAGFWSRLVSRIKQDVKRISDKSQQQEQSLSFHRWLRLES